MRWVESKVVSDSSSEGVTEVNVLPGETETVVVLGSWEGWFVEGEREGEEGRKEGDEGRREGGEVDLCEGDMSILAAERKSDGVTSFGDIPAEERYCF